MYRSPYQVVKFEEIARDVDRVLDTIEISQCGHAAARSSADWVSAQEAAAAADKAPPVV